MLQINLRTPASHPIQAANRIGKDTHELSKVAYIVTDDEQLGADVCSTIEANGIQAKWFRSASAYLAYQRPAIASCLLISRGLSVMSGLDFQWMLAGAMPPPVI